MIETTDDDRVYGIVDRVLVTLARCKNASHDTLYLPVSEVGKLLHAAQAAARDSDTATDEINRLRAELREYENEGT